MDGVKGQEGAIVILGLVIADSRPLLCPVSIPSSEGQPRPRLTLPSRQPGLMHSQAQHSKDQLTITQSLALTLYSVFPRLLS